MTNIFREIENDQHMRCTEIQGRMPINLDLFDTANLPRLIHQSDSNHEHDIEYLRKASKEGIIVMRGFDIKLQYENGKQRQNIHDGIFFINLSQNSEQIFSNDHDFITRLQEQQKMILIIIKYA
jgi:hypothetical protein